MNARIAELFRYPVKGLSPEPVTEAALEAGRFFPVDRVFAVENGPSGFSSDAPEHLPKIKFLMLMRNERLALFRSRYDAQARRHGQPAGLRVVARAEQRQALVAHQHQELDLRQVLGRVGREARRPVLDREHAVDGEKPAGLERGLGDGLGAKGPSRGSGTALAILAFMAPEEHAGAAASSDIPCRIVTDTLRPAKRGP
jgi:hypothetical protein